MALAHQHTFIVLTKRPERMLAYVHDILGPGSIRLMDCSIPHPTGVRPLADLIDMGAFFRPLPNVWLGISAEDQPRLDARLPLLGSTPAARRLISIEPLLGPIDLTNIPVRFGAPEGLGRFNALTGEVTLPGRATPCERGAFGLASWSPLDWVIVGGESGPGSRPMSIEWVDAIQRGCEQTGVPFFFKQWGEHLPVVWDDGDDGWGYDVEQGCYPDDADPPDFGHRKWIKPSHIRVGKHKAGRLLNGRTYDERPSFARADA